MKKLLLLSLFLLSLGLAGQTDTDIFSQIEEQVTTQLDPFWWGTGAASSFTPTSAPVLVKVAQDLGTITLRWNRITGEQVAGYLVFRDTTTDPSTVINVVPDNGGSTVTWADTTVSTSTTYYYRVAAISTTAAAGPDSNEVSGSVQDIPPPPAVTLSDADGLWLVDNTTVEATVTEVTGSGAPDGTYDLGEEYRWRAFENGDFNESISVPNATFDASSDWTLDTYTAISGGVCSWTTPDSSNRAISQDLGSSLVNAGGIWVIQAEISNYVDGYMGFFVGGSAIGPAITANGTYLYAGVTSASNTDIAFFGGNGFTGDLDNVQAWIVRNGRGDYWAFQGISTTNVMWDSVDIDLQDEGDYALEMRVNLTDYSNGYQALFTSYNTSNLAWWFGVGPGGGLHHGWSENGSSGTPTDIFSGAEDIYDFGGFDGTWCWIRYEFDYDDGTGQSVMRGAFSYDRGQLHDWEYTSWIDVGGAASTLDYYDDAGEPSFFSLRKGAGDAATGKLSDLIFYDEYDMQFDDPTPTTFYEWHAWQHNQDGTGTHPTTLTVTTSQTNVAVQDITLVTRPMVWQAGNFSRGWHLAYDASYTAAEDRTWLVYGKRQEENNTAGQAGFFEQTDATVVIDVREKNAATGATIEGFFNDGTNNLTTTGFTYDKDDYVVFGMAMDSSNFYVYADGNLETTSRGTVTGSMDAGSGAFNIAADQFHMAGFATFPVVLDSSGFDGAKTFFDNVMPGRSPIQYGGNSWSGGGGNTVVTPAVQTYDTYLLRFVGTNSASDSRIGFDEISGFAAADGTGTDLFQNTDTDEGTRTAFPKLHAYPYNTGSFTAVSGEVTEWFSNRAIDNDAGTNFETTLTDIEGTDTSASNVWVWIRLTDSTLIKSITLSPTAADRVIDTVYVYGLNSDDNQPARVLKVETLAQTATDKVITIQ